MIPPPSFNNNNSNSCGNNKNNRPFSALLTAALLDHQAAAIPLPQQERRTASTAPSATDSNLIPTSSLLPRLTREVSFPSASKLLLAGNDNDPPDLSTTETLVLPESPVQNTNHIISKSHPSRAEPAQEDTAGTRRTIVFPERVAPWMTVVAKGPPKQHPTKTTTTVTAAGTQNQTQQQGQTSAVAAARKGRHSSSATVVTSKQMQAVEDYWQEIRKKVVALVTVLGKNNNPNQKNSSFDQEEDTIDEDTLRGITQRPSGAWQAQIYFAGKTRYIGVFDSKLIAARVYQLLREHLKQEGHKTQKSKNNTHKKRELISSSHKPGHASAMVTAASSSSSAQPPLKKRRVSATDSSKTVAKAAAATAANKIPINDNLYHSTVTETTAPMNRPFAATMYGPFVAVAPATHLHNHRHHHHHHHHRMSLHGPLNGRSGGVSVGGGQRLWMQVPPPLPTAHPWQSYPAAATPAVGAPFHHHQNHRHQHPGTPNVPSHPQRQQMAGTGFPNDTAAAVTTARLSRLASQDILLKQPIVTKNTPLASTNRKKPSAASNSHKTSDSKNSHDDIKWKTIRKQVLDLIKSGKAAIPDNVNTMDSDVLRGITVRPSGKFQSQMYFAGQSRYIGVFDSKEKAALAHELIRNQLKPKGSPNNCSGGDLDEDSTKATAPATVAGTASKNADMQGQSQPGLTAVEGLTRASSSPSTGNSSSMSARAITPSPTTVGTLARGIPHAIPAAIPCRISAPAEENDAGPPVAGGDANDNRQGARRSSA